MNNTKTLGAIVGMMPAFNSIKALGLHQSSSAITAFAAQCQSPKAALAELSGLHRNASAGQQISRLVAPTGLAREIGRLTNRRPAL